MCVRADSPDDVDEGEDVVQEVSDSRTVHLQSDLDLSDVDIYTAYAKESPRASPDSSTEGEEDEDGDME